MISANFIHRTFRIRCGDSVGTGFTVDIDGKQYLVTAKHVVKDFGPTVHLEVFGNGAWTFVPAHLVAHGADSVDLSVLAPSAPMSPPNLPVVASSDGLVYGQDVYFLGFPDGVLSAVIFGDAGHPLPFVKRALFSCFAGDLYLLDGHNNPGFSGSPVVFGRSGAPPNCVAAVVSGYHGLPEPVFLERRKTALTYLHNTGIIITYKIETALALIRGNPIGPAV